MSRRARVLVFSLSVGSAIVGCGGDPEVLKQEYLASGNRYFSDGKYKEAIVEFRNALQRDPRFGEARRRLAEAYDNDNDPSAAMKEYVQAAELLPDDVDLQIVAGNLLLMGGQFDEAKEKAERVVRRDPRHLRALILRANALAGLKDLDAAVGEISRAIEVDPRLSVTYTNLGIMQMARRRQAEAEAAFRKAVEVEPDGVLPKLALANFYWAAGRDDEAEAMLRTASAAHPENALANRALATFWIARGRVEAAEAPLRRLAEGTPGARVALADYYGMLGRRKEAVAVLDRLLVDPKFYAAAASRLAAMRHADGDRAGAHELLDSAIAKHPRHVDARVTKARLLLEGRRPSAAVAAARAAVSADPTSVAAVHTLGLTLAAVGELDEAAAAFTEALQRAPRATASKLELARVELARGRPSVSRRLAEQVATAQPNNADAQLVVVRALIAGGEVVRAEHRLAELIARAPAHAVAQSQMGTLQLRRDSHAAARRSFERALELDPASADAFEGLLQALRAAGNSAEASARLDARLAAAPKDVRLMLIAGRMYAQDREWDRSERVLRTAIGVDPSNLDAFMLLGRVYVAQQKTDLAVQELDSLVARRPDALAPKTMAAMIVHAQNRADEAQKRYEDILRHDPRAPLAANNLAWIYAENGGNLDVALQLAQVAKEQLPDRPEVDDTLGHIYLKKDLPGLAVLPLRRSVQKAPENPVFRYRLGLAYARLGDKVAARRELEQALAPGVEFPGAAEARSVLQTLRD